MYYVPATVPVFQYMAAFILPAENIHGMFQFQDYLFSIKSRSVYLICHWNFSLTLSFRPHYSPGIDSDSNGNKYQEYFLGVKTAGA